MKRFFRKISKSKKSIDPFPTVTDVVGSSSGPATLTSTVTTSTTDPLPSALASAPTANPQVVQASGVTTALPVSLPVSALASAPVAHLDANSPPLPDSIMQANVRSTESEQNVSTQLGLFSNAQNVLIAGGTFVNCKNYIPSAKTSEDPVPVPEKPNPSPFFTGRKDVLEKLGKIFVHRPNSTLVSRRSCLLWGMGGIGKTQICLKFIEEMSGSFTHVFWVDASSHESIAASLKGISGVSAAQAPVDGSVKSALQWISCIQEEWLIVFDNADDPPPEVVAKFIPPGNRGNILITSRNRSMGRVVSYENSIEINEMEESDAMTLLLRASCLDHSAEHLQAAKKIVIELGCIPLAVDHAGAYIEAGKCDISTYLKHLSLHRQTLMSDAAFTGASSYDKTVYGTWDLSFKEIERRASGKSTFGNAQAAQVAILILQICAFYHHSNISKDIFRSIAEESSKRVVDSAKVAGQLPQAITSLDHILLSLFALDNDDHWDECLFGQGIGVLLSFSLMKRGKSSEILSIHPLMQCWSREKMSKSEQQNMWELGSILLSYAVPEGSTSQDYALRRLIFPHIKACELHGMKIEISREYFHYKYSSFALVMQENGDWNNAEQLYFQVMNMRKKLLGAEHPHTLLSIENLAYIYSNQGRWNEAEQLEVQVLDIRKKLLGVEHPLTLSSLGNLASIYSNQGRWNEAEQLGAEVMEMRKKLLGAEHPDTLVSMANLASTYDNQGRWNEAEQLQALTIDMRKQLLGPEHPHTLLSMVNLASIYNNKGRWNEAEQLQVQVNHMMKKVLGPEHPDTLLNLGNLASTYHHQGRWNEAEQLEVEVMEMRKKLLGVEHPHTLSSMEHLAFRYCTQGRWKEAEQLAVEIMEIRKQLLGPEHPHTLLNMEILAATYFNQGRCNEAEQIEILVIHMRKKVLGAEHPHTLSSMENIASIYCSQGLLSEAEQLQLEVMNTKKIAGTD